MKMSFGRSGGKLMSDIDGFAYNFRYIILSKVISNTIPDVLDVVFNLFSSKDYTIPANEEKTKVTVINISEVFGDIHGRKDVRNRNVYMHHGFIDQNIESVNGDSIIVFTGLDYNVIADKPSNTRGPILGETVKTSYGLDNFENYLYRDTNYNSKILIPSPNFYDEKDMVLVGQHDVSYLEEIQKNDEYKYYSDNRYLDGLFKISLNDMIDKNTQVAKIKISIEHIGAVSDDQIDVVVEDLAANVKFSLESNGFSGAEVIFDAQQGTFNINDIRTYLDLDKVEQSIGLRLLMDELSRYCYEYMDPRQGYNVMMKVSYNDVKVRIVHYGHTIGMPGTDIYGSALGERLRSEQMY